MRVVITGAAGFLGSHLTDRFLAEGHEVVGVDNFITGSPKNIAHLEEHRRAPIGKAELWDEAVLYGAASLFDD